MTVVSIDERLFMYWSRGHTVRAAMTALVREYRVPLTFEQVRLRYVDIADRFYVVRQSFQS